MTSELIILLVTIFTACSCALVGNFLVVRKLSLMGDAISHSVLPGIVVAFLMAGKLDSPLFFLMSVVFAVLMALIIQWIVERARVSEESVIGIVFTFLFAVGVILLVQFAENVHLDQDAVLYGQVEFAAFDPMVLWRMFGVFALNLLLVFFFWKELKITSFDPALAKSLGYSPRNMHYFLMILTSVTVVAAFEAVGAILVVALLVVPALAAYVFCKRLWCMVLMSLVFAVLASVLGNQLAFAIDGSIAGAVAVMSGVILAVIVILKRILLRVRRPEGKMSP